MRSRAIGRHPESLRSSSGAPKLDAIVDGADISLTGVGADRPVEDGKSFRGHEAQSLSKSHVCSACHGSHTLREASGITPARLLRLRWGLTERSAGMRLMVRATGILTPTFREPSLSGRASSSISVPRRSISPLTILQIGKSGRELGILSTPNIGFSQATGAGSSRRHDRVQLDSLAQSLTGTNQRILPVSVEVNILESRW